MTTTSKCTYKTHLDCYTQTPEKTSTLVVVEEEISRLTFRMGT